MLTALFRQERFAEGAVARAIDAGVLARILRRAETLAGELERAAPASGEEDPRDVATRERDRDVWADVMGATPPDVVMARSIAMHPSELVALHLLLLSSSGPDRRSCLPSARVASRPAIKMWFGYLSFHSL